MYKANSDDKSYHVVTVEKSNAPRGMTGDDWHHYVIARGDSIIEGQKVGTLKDVTDHAEELAERINARSDKYGMVYVSSYSIPKKN
ncbi:MAG: hypothetical protein OEZ15_05900 [Gammaproteobacteria bacterium]|nr:hypothetical protein [Gammaproteobacteria bacterium]